MKDIIVEQAIEILMLKKEVEEHKEFGKKVCLLLYGIGAPLNDNKLGYTKEQLEPFAEIVKLIYEYK